MTEPRPSAEQTEMFLRASRRALVVVLLMGIAAGATLIAHALRPGSLMADWAAKAPWLIPVVIVSVFFVMTISQRKAGTAAANAVLHDEFRQANLSRATRFALVVVVIAQFPIAFAIGGISSISGELVAMAASTMTLSLVALIVSFLFFDRG